MSELLFGPETQSNFPFVDLSKRNSLVMAYWLKDLMVARQVHEQGEQIVPSFKLTHDAVRRGPQEVIYETSRMQAISYGATVLEAIATLVQAESDAGIEDFMLATRFFVASPSENNIRKYMITAEESFRAELPETTELVAELAGCHSEDGNYAVVGAALTRQLTLDAETALGAIVKY